jgi:hypothetical protein
MLGLVIQTKFTIKKVKIYVSIFGHLFVSFIKEELSQ